MRQLSHRNNSLSKRSTRNSLGKCQVLLDDLIFPTLTFLCLNYKAGQNRYSIIFRSTKLFTAVKCNFHQRYYESDFVWSERGNTTDRDIRLIDLNSIFILLRNFFNFKTSKPTNQTSAIVCSCYQQTERELVHLVNNHCCLPWTTSPSSHFLFKMRKYEELSIAGRISKSSNC